MDLLGATVVGISADKPEIQRKFIDKFQLTFPMIPDAGKRIIDAYGAREVLGMTAKRKTFLVAPDGKIARVWPNVTVEGHVDEVLHSIEAINGFAPGTSS